MQQSARNEVRSKFEVGILCAPSSVPSLSQRHIADVMLRGISSRDRIDRSCDALLHGMQSEGHCHQCRAFYMRM